MAELSEPPDYVRSSCVTVRAIRREATIADLVPKAAAQMLELLATSLHTTTIQPSLRANSIEAYSKILRSTWREYAQTVDAMRVVLEKTVSKDTAADIASRFAERQALDLVEASVKLAGAEAADEIDFSATTYQSAQNLVSKFASMPDPADPVRDAELRRVYGGATALHEFGGLSLLVAASDAEATSTAIRMAFKLVREGAIRAYQAAREAYTLRSTVEVPVHSPLPFDDEDQALADAE